MALIDRISIAGLILGVGAILAGQVLEGGHLASLLQPTAFLIVIGGTLGAVMLQSPASSFREGMHMLRWVFVAQPVRMEELIERVLIWSHIARREGLLALEGQFSQIDDPYHLKGLQLLVDGTDPGRLREVMEIHINGDEHRMKLAARIWEAAGGYAPTIGILGAVMGLIQVMENLTEPAKLGAGVAVAFVSTIYGVGLANLVFLPIARKLQTNINQFLISRELYLDGLVGIANGDNPHVIEGRMRGHLV